MGRRFAHLLGGMEGALSKLWTMYEYKYTSTFIPVLGILAREESVASSMDAAQVGERRKSSVLSTVASVPHKVGEALGSLKLSSKGSDAAE